jgi:hypothetical protein
MSNNEAILVKGVAGLGNRTLALLSAACYADTHQRQIYVDWTDAVFGPNDQNATQRSNLFSLLFKSDTASDWDIKKEYEEISPPIWTNNLQKNAAYWIVKTTKKSKLRYFFSYKQSSIDLGKHHHEGLLVYWSWRELIHCQRKNLKKSNNPLYKLSDSEILQATAKKHLQPSALIKDMSFRFFEDITSPTIGLHIRYSDLKTPVKKLIKQTEKLIQTLSSPIVVLCTDNKQIEDLVKTTLSAKVLTTNKEFGEKDRPLHYDASCTNREQRAIEAMLDMQLLSECDYLIHSGRSSFGYVASILAKNDIRRIDVDRYNFNVNFKRIIQKYAQFLF